MAKSYRDEAPAGNQKTLIIVLIALVVIGAFLGFVYPGIWLPR